MQASKIEIGRIYAVNRDGSLARFQVSAVVTKRVNAYGNPHDYESTVEGRYFDDERPKTVVINPKTILGPYEEQAELKALADAKKAAQEAENKRREDLQLELYRALYAAAGLTPPNDHKEYRQAIRPDSGYGVDIEWEAVEKLVEYFRARRQG